MEVCQSGPTQLVPLLWNEPNDEVLQRLVVDPIATACSPALASMAVTLWFLALSPYDKIPSNPIAPPNDLTEFKINPKARRVPPILSWLSSQMGHRS